MHLQISTVLLGFFLIASTGIAKGNPFRTSSLTVTPLPLPSEFLTGVIDPTQGHQIIGGFLLTVEPYRLIFEDGSILIGVDEPINAYDIEMGIYVSGKGNLLGIHQINLIDTDGEILSPTRGVIDYTSEDKKSGILTFYGLTQLKRGRRPHLISARLHNTSFKKGDSIELDTRTGSWGIIEGVRTRNNITRSYDSVVSPPQIVSTPPTPPELLFIKREGHALKIKIRGIPNQRYIIEESKDWRSWSRSSPVAYDPSGEVLLFIPIEERKHKAFFRARSYEE